MSLVVGFCCCIGTNSVVCVVPSSLVMAAFAFQMEGLPKVTLQGSFEPSVLMQQRLRLATLGTRLLMRLLVVRPQARRPADQ